MFEVHAQNIPCGSSGVTCTKQVDVHIHWPKKILISLLRGREMIVDGTPQPVPYYQDDFGIGSWKQGMWLIVSTKLGLRVMWDGGTRVQVRDRF